MIKNRVYKIRESNKRKSVSVVRQKGKRGAKSNIPKPKVKKTGCSCGR